MEYFLTNFGPLIIIVAIGVIILTVFPHLASAYSTTRWLKEVINRQSVPSRRDIVNPKAQQIDDGALRNKDTIITGLLAELSTQQKTMANLQHEIGSLKNQIIAKNEKIRKLTEINKSFKVSIDQLRVGMEARNPSQPGTSVPRDEKFVSVKREFAKMYHPNNTAFTGMEQLVRGELFKEFWQVLERIEAT